MAFPKPLNGTTLYKVDEIVVVVVGPAGVKLDAAKAPSYCQSRLALNDAG